MAAWISSHFCSETQKHSSLQSSQIDSFPSKEDTSRKIYAIVAKIFATLSAFSLGLTFYTIFWFTAAPVTVITAFAISAAITVLSGVVASVFLYLYCTAQVEEPQKSKPQQPHIGSFIQKPASSATTETQFSITTPIYISEGPLPSKFEVLQKKFNEIPFTSDAFEHREFFKNLGEILHPRDWTQKILYETSHMTVSEISKKWPQLFSKGVLQKADILERLHKEVASISSFENLTDSYPELFFEMGFLTLATPRLHLLVKSYVLSHTSFLLKQEKSPAFQRIMKYQLMPPSLQQCIGRMQSTLQNENHLFAVKCKEISQEFEQRLQPIKECSQLRLALLSQKMNSLRLIEKNRQQLIEIEQKIQIHQMYKQDLPNIQEMEDVQKSIKALDSEINKRQNQAKSSLQSFQRELEKLKKWHKYQGLNIQQIEQQIDEINMKLQSSQAPVQGLGAAWSAFTEQKNLRARLDELQNHLDLKREVDTYQINPEQAGARLQELSQKTLQIEEEKLQLPTLRARSNTEKQKLNQLKAKQDAYQNLLELQGKREALFKTLDEMCRSCGLFFGVNVKLEQEKLEQERQEIEFRFAKSENILENEHKKALEEEKNRHQLALMKIKTRLQAELSFGESF